MTHAIARLQETAVQVPKSRLFLAGFYAAKMSNKPFDQDVIQQKLLATFKPKVIKEAEVKAKSISRPSFIKMIQAFVNQDAVTAARYSTQMNVNYLEASVINLIVDSVVNG